MLPPTRSLFTTFTQPIYHFHAAYLHLHTQHKPCFYGCSVATFSATSNVTPRVGYCVLVGTSSVPLKGQFVCSDQRASFIQFLDFALYLYIAQVFSESFFQMVPVAPAIIDMTFVFIFHMFCVSVVRSLCCRIFSPSFFITFLSPETARSSRIHIPVGLVMDYVIRFVVMVKVKCSRYRPGCGPEGG